VETCIMLRICANSYFNSFFVGGGGARGGGKVSTSKTAVDKNIKLSRPQWFFSEFGQINIKW